MGQQVHMVDDDGVLWEIDPGDVEFDGEGFWYLASAEEDHEDYYELCDGEYELED